MTGIRERCGLGCNGARALNGPPNQGCGVIFLETPGKCDLSGPTETGTSSWGGVGWKLPSGLGSSSVEPRCNGGDFAQAGCNVIQTRLPCNHSFIFARQP